MARPPTVSYRAALVTWIDILGFSNLVETAQPQEIYDSIQSLRRTTRDEDDGREEGQEIQAVTFTVSDAVLRVRFLDPDYRYGHLFMEVWTLAWAQCNLAINSRPIRGALVANDICTGRNYDAVFGPAFNEAYRMETNDVVHPCIRIDDEVWRLYLDTDLLISETNSGHNRHFDYDAVFTFVAHDGVKRFVNYLRISGEDGEIEETLRLHRTYAANAYNTNTNARVKAKYAWVILYHNAFIDFYKNAPELINAIVSDHGQFIHAMDSLKIDISLPSDEFQFTFWGGSEGQVLFDA